MTPWVVVGGHRPIYIDSTFYGLMPDGDQYVAKKLRDSLEDLLYRYQVCVVVVCVAGGGTAVLGRQAGACGPTVASGSQPQPAAPWVVPRCPGCAAAAPGGPCNWRSSRPAAAATWPAARPAAQVDATWTGHHHSYQRTCAVYRGRCLGANADGTARAPLHLVIGEPSAAAVDAGPVVLVVVLLPLC